MLAFSNDYYGFIFRVTQSVELFCTYVLRVEGHEHSIHLTPGIGESPVRPRALKKSDSKKELGFFIISIIIEI